MDNHDREKYLLGLNQEKLHISNKDGAFTPHEQKRLDQITQIQSAAPDLQKTLIALEKRQQQETLALRNTGAGQQQYAALAQRHDQERDRYVRQHEKAKEILREANENAKDMTKDRGFTR